MKIAFISDVHGNYLALNEVLGLINSKLGISEVYFLGDAVGYMPDANKVVSRLRQDKVFCLMGNHEAMLLDLLPVKTGSEDIYKLGRAKKELSASNLSFIEQLLPFHTLSIGGHNILMVHGSPKNPLNGYQYEDTTFYPIAEGKYDLIFLGHTHRPYITTKNETTYVNVGSCGLPRDVGNLASFAVFDTLNGEVKLHRVLLNVSLIIDTYKDAVHPAVIDCLLRNSDTYNGELIN